MPAIACDVDGVLLRGTKIIGNSREMIKKIFKPREDGKRIVFTLLTNNGGFTEDKKAEEMNTIMQFEQEENPRMKFQADQIIQCHTPLNDKELLSQFADEYVLVCGYDQVLAAALSYGYKKAIHVDELAAVYPKAVPLDVPMYSTLIMFIIFRLKEDRMSYFKKDLEVRFGKSIEELESELKFKAIFIMQGTIYSDLTIQIFADIIGSKDGYIMGERRKPGDPQTTTLVATNPDLVWPYHWPVPRFGPKTLMIAFQAIFKAYYGMEVDYIQYGKPESPTYKYCEKLLKTQAEQQEVEISNFYMIGDNPNSDIDGANRMGWVSILTRTGVFQGGENSEEHPATYVVQDMEEAVKLIFKLENLDFDS